MPRALQEQPVLRIRRPGSLWSEAEEIGVEFLYPVQQRSAPNIRVIREDLLADAGRKEVLLRQGDNRFLTTAQIVPERRYRVGAGKSAGHADNRNRVGRQRSRLREEFVVTGHARSPTFRRAAARCRDAARCWARLRTSFALSVLSCSLRPS